MEEMPVMTVPDTENKDNFIIVQDKSDHDLSSQEAEDENLKLNDLENEIDEFDLSSISAKAMSREEIIAAAEAAAFAEEN
jgi:ribonuclease-3